MQELLPSDKPQTITSQLENKSNKCQLDGHLTELNQVQTACPKLRNYQKRVIKEIYGWYHWGKKSVMLVSPTGSGKTLTATHIVTDAITKKCRVLFIVHRDSLINQTTNTLINYGVPTSLIGYVKAGYSKPQGHELVIVASIQTLARRDYPIDIGLVIFDECHTTTFFKSAQKLIYHYAQAPVVALSKTKFLHLTATPYRTKQKEYFGNHVEVIVKAPDIKELIRMGYLVPARHFGYNGITDFSQLETGRDGDFKASQVNTVCGDLEYNQQIVNKFKQVCPNRKAISFAAGVEQSKLLTKLFNDSGILTEHIQAETPIEERNQIYHRFKIGQTQILSSIGTLTEGFDEPSVEAVIIARPTKSLPLLIQMCGRGLRLSLDTGKEDCLLLDFGENFTRKHMGRIDQKRKISLCPDLKKKPQNVNTKECPNCHAQVNILSRICPECGHVFLLPDKPELDDNYLAEFGELLDEETKKQVTYIRSQRKARFTKKQPPDDLWKLWEQRYKDTILCNAWLYQAVYRGDHSIDANQEFLSYLKSFGGCDNWVKFHMELEFGSPNRTYKSKIKGDYSPPPLNLNQLKWWEILQVSPQSNLKAVTAAYRELARANQPFDDQIKLLNWAYDQYLYFE